MSDKFGKAFCVLPWIHSFVNIGGEYQICCTAEEFHEGIPDANGKYLKIQDRPDLDLVMNSDYMKKLRLSLLDGEMPEPCTRCLITETHGGISRRHHENSRFESIAEELIDSTNRDGTIPVNIRSADYRLGNICNLQCRMCNPRSTVMWLKDWNEVKDSQESMTENYRTEYSNYNWIDDDHLIRELESKINDIEVLHFAGGEPLIAPRMTEMLQMCIDRKVAHKIMLTYNTNITRLPEKVLELWKNFKEVRLLCSIDGFGKVNEYIRMPSKWDVIDKNLNYLDDHAEEFKITEILLSATVQAYNVLNLDELYLYLQKFKNIVQAPNLISLFSPDYLMTQVLPPHVKAIAAKRLEALKPDLEKRLPTYKHYLIDNIDETINFMTAKNLNTYLWSSFVEYNEKVDKKKGYHMADYIPELSRFIQGSV